MIKYTKEYIAKLLDKYMDGTSTLGEEDILADYFHRGNVPEATLPGDRSDETSVKSQEAMDRLERGCISGSSACFHHVAADGTASYGKNISSTDRKG